MTHRIAIAPSGFKESLSAARVAEAIAVGVRRVIPDAELDLIPLVDGGEGTAEALALAGGGRLVPCTATGPVGEPVASHFALLGGPGPLAAVVEMAAVAGLALVPPGLRHPGATTTYGVGELIRAALDSGARRILIGCGDSGTSDGGAGALQALGARLADRHGRELRRGGGALHELERIDASGLDPRLARTELLVACNPYNVLCGKRGVARAFGPQRERPRRRWSCSPTGLERLARPRVPAGRVPQNGDGLPQLLHGARDRPAQIGEVRAVAAGEVGRELQGPGAQGDQAQAWPRESCMSAAISARSVSRARSATRCCRSSRPRANRHPSRTSWRRPRQCRPASQGSSRAAGRTVNA
ncbi:hypothetical protein SCYAM73S_03103 [Streptomyces cyaneofuscatus]